MSNMEDEISNNSVWGLTLVEWWIRVVSRRGGLGDKSVGEWQVMFGGWDVC